MTIPPASPNRIMCRHSRAWCRLCRWSAVCCGYATLERSRLCRWSAVCCGSATLIWLLADRSASVEVPGEFAVGCITKGYTTERADSPEVCWLDMSKPAGGRLFPRVEGGDVPNSYAVSASTTTFLARVLNLTPFGCFTVMETWPVFPVLISCTVPVFPACVPPMTLHRAPSCSWPVVFVFIFGSIAVLRQDSNRF